MRQFATYAVIFFLIIVVSLATIAALGQNSNNTFNTVKKALPTGR